MACIDPAALILNSNQGSSNASPCISTPGSRRHSSFSICGDLENDDDQHAEMHSMFEGNFTLSTPPLTARTSATQEHHVPTQPFMQDLVLPDGAVYRFDGTSLVAVSRSHFGDMSNSRNASPSLTPAPFTNNSAMNHALSMMIPPRASLTDITHFGPPMLPTSSGEEPERAVRHRETRGRSIIKSLSLKNLSLKNLSLKNLSLKKNSVVRRTSLDSASSSSSCSTGPPHSDMSSCNTLGSGSGSSSNNIVNNIKYRKEGTGEFQCPFDNCTYRYNLRRELNRHRNVHLYAGKDKYRCMNCNSGLCRLDSVKRHMEAKGKAECLKKGLYQEFKENGELVRVRKCKPSWYEAAAANAAAALNSCKP
ncbi:hypothetical protein BGX27_003753 [Mortierella sp. AM989]|nr:hypothetical protein BGX27_003753 [Mortierella sp. AM989]